MSLGIIQPFDLTNRVVIVTGGAMGIGAGIAEVLASAGANVVIADRDVLAGGAHSVMLIQKGFQARAVKMDVADEDSVVSVVADIVAADGTPWALVNNAGIQDRQPLLQTESRDWDGIQATNARGSFLVLREVAKAMVQAGTGGRIVNIASLGLRHPMAEGLAAYTASKGAVMGLTQNAAFELAAHGITVNAVQPGSIVTPGTISAKGSPVIDAPGLRRGKLGDCQPEDIGAATLFFVSPAARYVTNQVIAVDGGFMLS